MIETISQVFLNTIKSYQKKNLLLYKKEGAYVPISTKEVGDWVKQFSLGLRDIEFEPGDKLVLIAEDSPEWIMTDLAVLCSGGITVPIYTSLVSEQIKYIIDDSDAKIVVCSNKELWEKIRDLQKEFTKVKHYILLQPEAPEGVFTLDEILERGKRISQEDSTFFERMAMEVKPDDIASIVYTSGTTGIPKGVMLTHRNFISNIKSTSSIIEFSHKDMALSFLPLSHVLERMVNFTYFYRGCSIGYAESVETIGENLIELKPTIMVSVPRVFEKIYSKVIDTILAGSAVKRKIFFWALKVGKEYSKKEMKNSPISKFLRLKRSLAHKLVFSKIIEKTGGRFRVLVSGGAALSKDIAEFFHAMGIIILEGYGLTETSPVITVNTFENLKFGTVGKPIPGVEVKIADDAEIITRGPNVMKGYYKKESQTNEAFEEGWFHTGDIGYLDEGGFLVITDRKKDIIVTSGGKNVAPQMIENMIRISSYVSNVMVVGDKRKYIIALVVPEFEKLEEYASFHNIHYENNSELVKNEKVLNFMKSEVDRFTQNLSSYEKIKKIILLSRDFEIAKGEMTPSLKVKRNFVEQEYKELIDSVCEDF